MTSDRVNVHPAQTITQAQAEEIIGQACHEIMGLRGRPLLVLYYPGPYGLIGPSDVPDCYQAFRNADITHEEPLQECDVLIHTLGGEPVSAYCVAQCVRAFAKHVVYLVPEMAYSAGTLLCFSGNQIRLGHCAGLSAIDITIPGMGDGGGDEEIELTSIDYFMDFAKDSQQQIQTVLGSMQLNLCADVGSDLLCQLVQQVGALKVGEYYRTRTLTGYYAQELLDRYMLTGLPNAEGRRNRIIHELLFRAPAHQFYLDFHMCGDLQLVVEEMCTNESDATKNVVSILNDLAQRDIICPNVTNEYKVPFIAYFSEAPAGESREQ